MADEENVAEGPEEAGKKPKSKGGGGLVKAIGVIVAMLIVAVLVAFGTHKLLTRGMESDVADTEEVDTTTENSDGRVPEDDVEDEQILSEFPLELVVNIANTDGQRYLKVRIEVAYDKALSANKDLVIQAGKRKSKIQGKAIEYLSGLTLKEVLDMNAKQNIRRDLLREFNKEMPLNAGTFSNVYITEYLVQ